MMSMQGGYLKCRGSKGACVKDVPGEGQNTRNLVDIMLLWPGRETDLVSHQVLLNFSKTK